MSLQTVIIQNQQTVAFLGAKDYCSAVVSSSSALESLGSISSTQQDNILLPARRRISSSHEESSIDQCMLQTNIWEDDRAFVPDNFMYTHPIPLPPNVAEHDMITSVLIFNAALAHHLMAGLDNEWSPRFLHRAKQLYTLAYNSSKDIEQNPLFLFALYNNTALVNLVQTGDKDSWNPCVEHLVYIYMVMVDEGDTSRLHHLRGFLESLVASMPTAAAA
ncbi:unnamed protein product [Cylindrotheca closterium]|uniref:Uncharacterized protein n=1 Tax=Cylindrotheca closterium TaxID=2856 RepID=A0AAD2JN21_9STRA|nr:unnamed protein product [Cylindrotheca closterium]